MLENGPYESPFAASAFDYRRGKTVEIPKIGNRVTNFNGLRRCGKATVVVLPTEKKKNERLDTAFKEYQ